MLPCLLRLVVVNYSKCRTNESGAFCSMGGSMNAFKSISAIYYEILDNEVVGHTEVNAANTSVQCSSMRRILDYYKDLITFISFGPDHAHSCTRHSSSTANVLLSPRSTEMPAFVVHQHDRPIQTTEARLPQPQANCRRLPQAYPHLRPLAVCPVAIIIATRI